jgi:hypothetical protein
MQGKAYVDCKSMFLDFGLDGTTIMALSDRDLEVRSRDRTPPPTPP